MPASLLTDEARLTATSAAQVPGSGARRAEQVRQTAVQEFFRLDDVNALNRAASRHVRAPRPFDLGTVVYYWREQGAGTMSRRLLNASKGW